MAIISAIWSATWQQTTNVRLQRFSLSFSSLVSNLRVPALVAYMNKTQAHLQVAKNEYQHTGHACFERVLHIFTYDDMKYSNLCIINSLW